MEPEQNDQQNAQARARQNRDLAKKTKEGAIWTVLFDAVEFVIQTGSSIILARILFPEDYGLMGLASISIQLARRFTNFGFNLVLVQRKTLEKEHLDTVFWTNLGLMVLTTALLVVASPFLSDFFNEPRLTAILIAVSINFIFSAIGGVSQALMKRKMQFKELGLSVNLSNVSGIVLSVVLALMDYGVWSLVYGQLFTSLSQSLMMMGQARWLPRFSFKMWALKDCMSF
nr:oligosaccharide flippase family protein [Calditrichia bacterium]